MTGSGSICFCRCWTASKAIIRYIGPGPGGARVKLTSARISNQENLGFQEKNGQFVQRSDTEDLQFKRLGYMTKYDVGNIYRHYVKQQDL